MLCHVNMIYVQDDSNTTWLWRNNYVIELRSTLSYRNLFMEVLQEGQVVGNPMLHRI